MRYRIANRALWATILCLTSAMPSMGQTADEEAVVALADSALALISSEDWQGLTDLYLDEQQSFTVYEREGVFSYRVRTRAEDRARPPGDEDLHERGYDPSVHVAGHLATVWLPYDFYIDGEWSHCGVDAFTFLRTADGWRIASLAWTVQQPPECAPHPDGPPPR